MARRPLAVNPYVSDTVETWLSRLEFAPSLEQRYQAFTALSQLQPPAAVCALAARLLEDREGELRAAAAHWLAVACDRGWLNPADVAADLAGQLTARLSESDPEVQLACLRALSRLGAPAESLEPIITRMIADDEAEPTSMVILADLCRRVPDAGRRNLAALRRWLVAEQADLREGAALALLSLGADGVEALPEWLLAIDDEEPLVRETAARALGLFVGTHPEVRAALEEAVTDADPGVAAAAREALGE